MTKKIFIHIFILLLFPLFLNAETLLIPDQDEAFLNNDLYTQADIRVNARFKVINPFSKVSETGGLFLEAGGRINPDIAMARIGVFRTYNGWLSFLVGLEGLSDDDDHTFGGATAGFRVKLPYVITPFVGVHFFAGTYEEEVDADTDGIDNDDDGAIDETNEKKWETADTMVATCPEIGLMMYMDKDSQLVLSAKHYFTDKGRDSDFWVYSVGINIVF